MSRISNSVAIIGVEDKNLVPEIFGVTISSLISLSVEEGGEEVLFALKRNSFASNQLQVGDYFSINVCSDSQREIAEYFGKRHSQGEDLNVQSFANWNFTSNVPTLLGSHISMVCVLKEKQIRSKSILFISGVQFFLAQDDTSPLLHYRRKFFSPNSIPL